MKIACLHTAESNVAVFDAAAMALGIPTGGLHHEVRADLLAATERTGGLRDEIAQATQQALLALAPGADAVLLTWSTLGPTARLFKQAAQATGATVEVQGVPGAWALFKAGDIEGYLRIIAKAADSAYAQGASVVALAQASMSGAAALVTAGGRPLSSPGGGAGGGGEGGCASTWPGGRGLMG